MVVIIVGCKIKPGEAYWRNHSKAPFFLSITGTSSVSIFTLTLRESLKAYSHVFNYTFYTIELLSLKNNISFIQKKKIFMELSVVFFLHVETSDSKSCIESDTI